MKSLLLPLLFITVLISCKQNTAPEIEAPNATHIVNEAIKVAGGDTIASATLQFKFRDKMYKAVRDGGAFTLNRSFTDSIGEVRDVLSNSGFTRFVNNKEVTISDSIANLYSNAVNSVHYFSILPIGLNDGAVYKTYLDTVTLNDKSYHKIKVTFSEENGGEDFDDVFVYWFSAEDYKLDYLAYQYHVNGGGIRFREAFNERYIKGARIVDYNNYKPETGAIDIETIDDLFKAGKLQLLSKIELENVSVE
ncbi:MAG: deoxyribose-phosphate aldolase [Bizionia sp.]|nr:deoxyribose-phosphate aldolase [Bizionia sp.]